MGTVKLQRHDVIEIKAGATIIAKIPQKFVYVNTTFSEKLKETTIIVGKLYSFPLQNSPTIGKINSCIKESVEDTLSSFGLNSDLYKEKINDFIKNLNLKIPSDTFDTSIYEGKYKVYFVEGTAIDDYIYCEKLDESEIEIKLKQSDINEKVLLLKRKQ